MIELHPDENDKSKAVRIAINGKTGTRLLACNISELWLPEEYVKSMKAFSVFLGTNLPAGEKRDLSIYKNSFDNIDKDRLTRKKNQKFFDYLCDDVFKRPCFALLPGVENTIRDVIDNRPLFENLPTLNQVQILNELIKVLQNKNSKADLTYLSSSLVSKSGNIALRKEIPSSSLIIAQSVTGFYEKVLFQVPED